MATFFVSWPLWEQLSFALLGALVATIGVGFLKNIYTWRRDRHYVKIYGPAGNPIVRDIEAPAMAEIDAIPFGIRALQSGIEVEGVWISQPNSPIPGSPVTTAKPSPVPSIVGGLSPVLSPYEKFPPLDLSQTDHVVSHSHLGKTPVIPNFSLDMFDSSLRRSLDYFQDLPLGEGGSRLSTLEALEGRPRPVIRTNFEDYRQSRTKSRSETSSHFAEGSSGRDGSPSPPALTDSASRADTPLSTELRPGFPSYLSESNHRLSHVAETGQIQKRVRTIKRGEAIVIPAYHPLAYKATFNFSPGQLKSPNSLSPNSQSSFSQSSQSPMSIYVSDSDSDFISSPQPVLGSRRPEFDLQSFRHDTSPSQHYQPHIRTPSGNILIAGQHASPILAEYMTQSPVEISPKTRDYIPTENMNNSDVISLAPTTVSAPEAVVYPSEYRRVNSSFEVRRVNAGALAVPLELPPLPKEPSRISREEKRQSRKLQKKKPRSKSLGG